MKKSSSNEFCAVMPDYMKELYSHCVESLAWRVNNKEDSAHHHLFEDLFNLPSAQRLQQRIEETTEEEIFLELDNWITVYTTLGLHCVFFSEKSLARLQNEVIAHRESNAEEEIEQIKERVPKIRTLVNNLEKRFGHKPFFRQRHEEITRRGWFSMMDPLPRYNILK
jgi:hypothetical protein